MNKQTEALKLALDALDEFCELGAIIRPLEVRDALQEAMANIGNPIMEQLAIPTVITCPFCSGKHIPGWLYDYNMDRGVYGEQQ
jgi:hypothetical protein